MQVQQISTKNPREQLCMVTHMFDVSASSWLNTIYENYEIIYFAVCSPIKFKEFK